MKFRCRAVHTAPLYAAASAAFATSDRSVTFCPVLNITTSTALVMSTPNRATGAICPRCQCDLLSRIGLLVVVRQAVRLRSAVLCRGGRGLRVADVLRRGLTRQLATHACHLVLEYVAEGGEQADASHGDQCRDDDVLTHALTALASGRSKFPLAHRSLPGEELTWVCSRWCVHSSREGQ